MLKNVLLILSGNAAASLLLLLRNLVVARLIPIEDYGVASTFAITMALVEMSTQFGLQQQIVQDPDGDNEHFQSGLQGFQVLRGVLSGALLFFLSGTLAAFLNIPEVAWTYQIMAVMPVLRSFQHFDIHRLSRHMRFTPLLLTGGLPAFVSLLAVFPLAMWLNDYRVMLYVLLLQELLGVITSHAFAERRYRLTLDRALMAKSIRFGWPLLTNGILLFLVMQGDKVIVGRELGMAELGVFGMGITLTLTPGLVISKSAQNFYLPLLSKSRERSTVFRDLSIQTLQAVMLLGVVFGVSIVIVNEVLVDLLLGEKFLPMVAILPWLAVLQSIRILKAGPTIIALSLARTRVLVWGNLPRIMFIVPAAAAAASGGGLEVVIFWALAGEVFGLAVTTFQLRKNLPLSDMKVVFPGLLTFGIFVLCGWSAPAGFSESGVETLLKSKMFLCVALVAILPSFVHLFRAVRSSRSLS